MNSYCLCYSLLATENQLKQAYHTVLCLLPPTVTCRDPKNEQYWVSSLQGPVCSSVETLRMSCTTCSLHGELVLHFRGLLRDIAALGDPLLFPPLLSSLLASLNSLMKALSLESLPQGLLTSGNPVTLFHVNIPLRPHFKSSHCTLLRTRESSRVMHTEVVRGNVSWPL